MGEVSALANANPNKQPTVRARVRFAKTGVMRFVGHLDMMRFFQKAVRRAGLPIAYTAGFHPHQIMSFALPLGIGVTSEGEYMDIELTEKVEPDEAIRRLNEQMANGVEVLAFRYLPEKSKKAMAAVEAARYVVWVKDFSLPEISFQEGIQHFYEEADEIIITKKTKKSERQLDLKPLIYEFKVGEADDDAVTDFSSGMDDCLSDDAFHSPYFPLTLSAGSTDNIKPELVFSHFMKSLVAEKDDCRLGIHRLDLLGKDEEGQLVSLGEMNL